MEGYSGEKSNSLNNDVRHPTTPIGALGGHPTRHIGNNTAASVPSGAAPMNESQRGATRVDGATSETMRLIELLESRLSTVLHPRSPEKDSGGEEIGAGTIIGKFLQEQGGRVESTNRNIRSIIDRLEV